MERVALRLPPDLIRALTDQARDRGLPLGSFIRTQLLANLHRPANILKPKMEISS